MPFLSWLVGSKPKSPELKEAEAAFSESEERKDLEAQYNAVYKQLQAAYPGGRAAAPKGLDARHLALLVGPLWGCLDPMLAAQLFTLLASKDDGLVHLEQIVIAKAKLERLGEDASLDMTFRMLDVFHEGALRADALAAGIVSGVRMSLAAAAAVDAAAAGAGGAAGAGAAGAGAAGGGPGAGPAAQAAAGGGTGTAGAGAGQGAPAAAGEAAERAAAAVVQAAKALDRSLYIQQALAVCRGALLPLEPASSSSPAPAAASGAPPGDAGWTHELKAVRMSPDDYRRWTKRCPALHKALAGLLRHVGSAQAVGSLAGTPSGTSTPGQGPAGGASQGRGGAGAGGGGGPVPTTPTSSAGSSPLSPAQALLTQQYRHELPPLLTQLGKLPRTATLLHPVWTWLLSARLPPAQTCEWRLLFSSARDGKSFNTFFGRVSATPGPTLLLIKDKAGAVFGGYASQPWAKSGVFYGDVSCAIFSLLPDVQVYPATGINDNIQWCGVGFSQLPGGLGFGGAAGGRGHFALYVEPSLDSGMSRPIATFGNSASLASEQVFQIDTLECWLLQPPEDEDAAGGSDPSHSSHGGGGPRRGGGGSSSILDKAAEDRAIMKMAGMNLHSEGVRDEPLEED